MPPWLLHTLLTMLLWGGWGVLSKPLAATLSAWQMQSLSTLGLLPVCLLLARSSGRRTDTHRARGLIQAFAAGIITSLGNVACYQAMALGGKAAAVIPLTALYPLATIALALLFLGERLNPIQTAGILVALAALYCFNVGGDTGFLTPWLAVALVPIGCWGLSAFLQKLATNHITPELATLAFLVGFLPVAILTPLATPFDWTLSAGTWSLLVLLGLAFGLGNWTVIRAYGTGGRAAIVTPLASLYALVTIPLAVAFLGERVTRREGIGIGLALLAVIALSRETPSSASERPPNPPPAPSTPIAALL